MANTTAILSEAKPWLPVLMVGPAPIGDAAMIERIARLSERMGAVCESLDVPFLSPLEALSRSDVWLREAREGDGAHPNSGGYEILARLVSEWEPWRAWVHR